MGEQMILDTESKEYQEFRALCRAAKNMIVPSVAAFHKQTRPLDAGMMTGGLNVYENRLLPPGSVAFTDKDGNFLGIIYNVTA